MKVLKIVALAALVTASALSMAQGRMMMGMRGGGGNKAMLLQRDDVKKDLALTSEQTKKLEDVQQDQQDKMRAAFQEMRDSGGQPDPDKMREMFTKMMKESEKAAMAVLTPEQQKRLKEIWVQVSGNRVVLDEDMQKELALTADQKAKVKALQAKQQEAMQSVMEQMRNQEIDRDQAMEIFKKNDKALDTELGKVLTAEQAAKLKGMAGKPFKADEENGGGH